MNSSLKRRPPGRSTSQNLIMFCKISSIGKKFSFPLAAACSRFGVFTKNAKKEAILASFYKKKNIIFLHRFFKLNEKTRFWG
jgi:hypothetical protein